LDGREILQSVRGEVMELGHGDAGIRVGGKACSGARMRRGERGSDWRKDKDDETKEMRV
jgi:hypothetical protein